MLDAFLPEDDRLGSDDSTGEVRCTLILRNPPGVASVVRGWDKSTSVPIIKSWLLETAARLDNPPGFTRNVELDNCIRQAWGYLKENSINMYSNNFREYLQCKSFDGRNMYSSNQIFISDHSNVCSTWYNILTQPMFGRNRGRIKICLCKVAVHLLQPHNLPLDNVICHVGIN